jgi:beta-lactamase regulating signal transducer with metallopeptidase domain
MWCLTFAALLLLFVLPAVVPKWDLEVLPEEIEVPTIAQVPATSNVYSVPVIEHRQPPPNDFPWLITLWLVGLVFFLGKIAYGLAILKGVRSRARPLSQHQRDLVLECLHHLEMKRPVETLLTSRFPVPVVWGLHRPVILLPESVGQWSEDRLRIAMIHELGHLIRRDPLTTLLTQVVCALYWVNPLVWLAARKLYMEREQACDELVLNSGAERLGYAQQLLELARVLQPIPKHTGLAMADKTGLKRRIQNILHHKLSSFHLSRRMVLLSTLVALVGVALLASIQLRARAGTEIDTSVARLHDGSPSERKKAAWSLGESEDPRAVQPLIQMLENPDPELRGLAAWALGEIKDRSAVAPLVAVMEDEDVYAREMIVRAIGEIEDPQTVSHLTRVLEDPESAVRAAAVWSLGEIGTNQALQAASGALSDPDPLVQTNAMRVLAKSDKNVALESLIDALSVPEPRVRQEAARALGRIGDPRAVEALIEGLRDPDPEVRSWVVWALDEINVSS